eukprot:Opistho-2@84192
MVVRSLTMFCSLSIFFSLELLLVLQLSIHFIFPLVTPPADGLLVAVHPFAAETFFVPMDVTPKVHVFEHQTRDLTYYTALTELIENAIEGTLGIPANIKRRITIKIDKSSKTIEIEDNGAGMSDDVMSTLGQLGATSHMVDLTNDDTLEEKHVTSEFGKYGIGRCAVVKFGPDICATWESRVIGSSCVTRVKFDYKQMNKDGMLSLSDRAQMRAHEIGCVKEHYTKLVIEHVEDRFFADWESSVDGYIPRLADRYYFYIHGMHVLECLEKESRRRPIPLFLKYM